MTFFINIGSGGTNGRNRSGVGSRGYEIVRKGRVVICRWAGVTVDQRRKFRWSRAPREKMFRLSSEQEARAHCRNASEERELSGYSKLPPGARILARDTSASAAPKTTRGKVTQTQAASPKAMRAISIRQPFVDLILEGKKTLEFRSQPTKLRERVYLYASAKPFPGKTEWRRAKCQPGELPTGVIVGSVRITDCLLHGDGYAYRLAQPRRLRKHLKPANQPQPRFWIPQFAEED